MPDNCDELQTLRKFRDTYMMSCPKRTAMVKEYYEKAPLVVSALSKLPNRKFIYERRRTEYIVPAVRAIKSGNSRQALELYKQGIAFACSFLS